MEHKQVVIYARVSSREQEREGFSIPAQLKLLKEYALKNGFQIVKECLTLNFCTFAEYTKLKLYC